MFESLGFEEFTARQASVCLGLFIGIVFGALAERTKFCFRRSIVGDDARAALGVWLTALAVAVAGTQGAVALGWISFDEHRFMAPTLPALAIDAGGLLFGVGMVLTRGCVSRLTVLGAGGNLRALTVLMVFAIVAHATLKGVLAPVRTTLGALTVSLGDAISLAALPGGAPVWTGVIVLFCLAVALRSGNAPWQLMLAALIGLLVPLAWVGTGFVLFDDFDPIAMESMSFTLPSAESLFFVIASSAIPASFGPGLVAGVLIGACAAALIFGTFRWQSFSTPRDTGRYILGAALMGFGGVLAGGCTLGAGLSGVPTLSLAAILGIVSIAVGGLACHALVDRRRSS